MKTFIQCFRMPLVMVILLLITSISAKAQPATFGVPVSIGRYNCGSGGSSNDSVFFFDYTTPNLTRAVYPNGYKPLIKIGPASTTNRFTINLSSVSFNPKDQKLYYFWTQYTPTVRTYIWRWRPDTTFSTVGSPGTGLFLDTVRSFPYDIGGVAFDNDGIGWTLEFPPGPASRAFLRPIDFAAGVYNNADTLDFIPGAGGIGDTIFVPGSGDITILPSGQMYYNFDNKLYTPDYSSYGDPSHHIKSTYIDTTRLPTSAVALVGLAYTNGDLVAAYNSSSCTYRRLDPVNADTAFVNYTYASGKGVRSVDMAQINSGIGLSKKLYSINPTGTAGQYTVQYDIYVRNYGNIPVTNIQVKDSLGSINTNANVSGVSATIIINPGGLAINPSYNGTSNPNLLVAGQTLVNYPEADDNFTIRITCTISNVLSGVVYNNSAIATGRGFNNNALRDSSTNGSNPDLNQNDKPDDLGEGQPTPFIISITPNVAPCVVLGQVMYSQTFGTGTGLTSTLPALPSASTTYTGSTTQPLTNNRFALTDSSQRGDLTNWVKLRDHTVPQVANGRMMVVNADAPANYFYRDSINILCPGQQYTFGFYAAFIGNSTYQTTCNAFGGFKFPRMKIRIRDLATGLIITEGSTPSITSTAWDYFGIKWVMPAGYTGVIFEMINDAPGGCGNDIAIDDIQFGVCDAAPTVSVNAGASGCLGGSTTFSSSISDPSVIPGTKVYQWQVSSDSLTWSNIVVGGTSANYTIAILTGLDVNKYYRVIIASTGNMGNASCQYTSPGIRLTAKATSGAASSISRNKNNICAGIAVNLSVVGGTLGTNAKWKWYTGTGTCGSVLIDSGATITVTPAVNTTYYVRAEGDCNTTSCVSIPIVINCDIDKDDDGIPDFMESNMAAAAANAFDVTYAGYVDNNNDFINDNFQADGDSNNDGIANYLDVTFPGRVDANGDGVDDRFDADKDGRINMLDLDSDNDGVPDVVEAYGVDNNGDGKIDNYTDTDGDGFSQNVDGNTSGARFSGLGLGLPDFDQDNIPNFIDLDSDNDGIPDLVEAGGPDTNNNGIVDGTFTDANNDGMHDSYINAGALLRTGLDGNSDGRADNYPNKNFDSDAKPNLYDIDSDADGIVDVIESGLPDANMDGRIDGTIAANGWSTTVSVMPALNLRNTDGRGNPDFLDIDADDDGIPDNIEGLPTAGYLFATGSDTDGDGLDNAYDNTIGFPGSGIYVVDTDGDGLPDYRDLDTDADGQPDIKEGNDFNLNGLADDNVTLTLLDTDGDGLDNRFDSSTSIKGTSYMMGNSGSLSGDPAPGSRSPVQKKVPSQTDRDWRFVGSTLPVQLIQFTASLKGNNVALGWTLITPTGIDRFEIERSTDNSSFSRIGIIQQPVALNIQQHLTYNDDITAVTSEIIFYRLKIISTDGQVKYSNVLPVRRNTMKTGVRVIPNPASDHFQVSFYAEKETAIQMKLINGVGQVVLTQNAKASVGQNYLQVNNLERLSNGVYNLQFFVNDEAVTTKIIISKK